MSKMKPFSNKGHDGWSDSKQFTMSLGCSSCVYKDLCGGVSTASGGVWCMDDCCGDLSCDTVCPRKSAELVERIREVGGLDLEVSGPIRSLEIDVMPDSVPLVYNRSGRSSPLFCSVVALDLYAIVDFRSGTLKFSSKKQLCAAYGICPSNRIVLSGTNQDKHLEKWWGLTLSVRRKLIEGMKSIGVDLVTTPNYSLFTRLPRTDDMHSMKRILLAWEEFVSTGMPAALHLNARNERDWERWRVFLQDMPEVHYVAAEFRTGAGWKRRRPFHVKQLCATALAVDRPLVLFVRGGAEVLHELRAAFAQVIMIDTTTFMRTINRQRAGLSNRKGLVWNKCATASAKELDDLLVGNVAVTQSYFSAKYPEPGRGI